MSDQTVKVADAPSGKAIEVSEIINEDDSITERQRVVLSDPETPNAHVHVDGEAGRGHLFTRDYHIMRKLDEIHDTMEEIRDLIDDFVHS